MGLLSVFFFPLGFFLVFMGTVIAINSPLFKEALDSVEFLQRNRRFAGVVMVIVGFVLMALS